jgi:hypothetical protein
VLGHGPHFTFCAFLDQAMLTLRYFRSSAINFSCWLLGHREDFNEWADIVGDDIWKWEGENGVKQRFRKIENVHDELDNTQAKYVSGDVMKEHSKEDKVDLSFGQQWAPVDTLAIDVGLEFGTSSFFLTDSLKPKTDFKQMKTNGDLNSGDPTGWELGPTTYFKAFASQVLLPTSLHLQTTSRY